MSFSENLRKPILAASFLLTVTQSPFCWGGQKYFLSKFQKRPKYSINSGLSTLRFSHSQRPAASKFNIDISHKIMK